MFTEASFKYFLICAQAIFYFHFFLQLPDLNNSLCGGMYGLGLPCSEQAQQGWYEFTFRMTPPMGIRGWDGSEHEHDFWKKGIYNFMWGPTTIGRPLLI
jgi:hypothetical protein